MIKVEDGKFKLEGTQNGIITDLVMFSAGISKYFDESFLEFAENAKKIAEELKIPNEEVEKLILIYWKINLFCEESIKNFIGQDKINKQKEYVALKIIKKIKNF